MRMTESMKQSIVRAVMADVPKVDYIEMASEVVRQAVFRAAPESIQAALQDKKCLDYLKNDAVKLFENKAGRSVYAGFRGYIGNKLRFTDAENEKLKEIQALSRKQEVMLEDLESKVSRALAGFSTAKRAVEALPEMAKYFPKEPEKIIGLPVVAGLVKDLTDAGLKLP